MKVACICVAACVIANMSLASNLSDLSEVKSGGLGVLMSLAGIMVAKRGGML